MPGRWWTNGGAAAGDVPARDPDPGRVRILIITEFFDPEPTIKGLAFATALAARGHQVQVLTGFPNYPNGRLYSGYKLRPVQRERHGNVEVVRVPLFPSHDRSAARRVATYLSFAASASLIGPLVTTRPDVVYVYHPPATVALAAMARTALRRVPFVIDIQDLWPDTLRATGMVNSRAVLKVVDMWCRRVYASAARVVVLSPGFRDALVSRGVPANKIDVIYNWATEDADAHTDAVSPRESAGFFDVVFAGTMGLAQALDVVLDAARIVAESDPGIRFVLIGGGVDKPRLERRAEAMQLENVRFLPPRPMQQMRSVLQSADALLIHLKDDPLFRITIPSKTQAYLQAGRPILIGARGDARDLVERAQAGIGFEPESPGALAEAVLALARQSPAARGEMGNRGRRYYESHLSVARGVDAFVCVFEKARDPAARRSRGGIL